MILLRDRRDEFEAAGVKAFGISRDSAWSHVAWSQALDLGDVPLLSDWNAEAVRGFGIAEDYGGMRDVARGGLVHEPVHGEQRSQRRRASGWGPSPVHLPLLARRAPARARRGAVEGSVQLPAARRAANRRTRL